TLFRRDELENNLDDELKFHVEMKIRENLEAGMSPEEARAAALRQFGNVARAREEARAAWTFARLETFAQDIRFGLRQLGRNPGFTAIAIFTLALGIGANTAIFSVVNGVLLNPLPFPEPDQLVALHASKPNFERGAISYPNFLDWQKENHSFSAIAVCRSISMNLTGMGEAERMNAEFITSDFFPLLGVKPQLGRTLFPGEDRIGAAPVVLISEGLWRRKFDSSREVLGKILTLDGKGYAVVGVIPAGFRMSSLVPSLVEKDAYLPIGQWDNTVLMARGAGLGIHGVGRLKPGVTLDQARADMAGVTDNLARAYPDTDKGLGATLVPLKEQVVGDTRPILFVLLAAVGFVLLIACVNVANLLLVRSSSRAREFAVRAALGAGRWRVVRQLLVESMLLASAGGGLGLTIAWWGTRSALGLLPATLPRAGEIAVDPRVIVFTAVVSILSGILFGALPALKGSKADLHETLKEGGRGASGARHRAQATFVAVELALALVLLIGAGLLIRSLTRLWGVDPGFNPRNLLTFNYAFPSSPRGESADGMRARSRQLEDEIKSIPRVQAAALTWAAFPMNGEDDTQFWLEGEPKPQSMNDMHWALSYVVGPEYFQAMGIPLERGRVITRQDDDRAPRVVMVDDVFARKFFPGQDPIGKRIHINDGEEVAEIVGVVGHVKQWGLDADDANPLRAQVYRAFLQMPVALNALPVTGIGVVVRSDVDPRALAESIRRATAAMGTERVVWGFQTMDEIISDSLASRRFAMTLLGAFAALALVLASVGIYGVISYLVDQRTHEIGVRMALGARHTDILRSVLGDGTRMALAGVTLGFGAALGLTRLLARYSLLFGVSPYDPLTFAGVAVLLTLVALVACYFPARRAMKVDPMVALRYE
ncbi:MAG TPA: ABC transporter permease, partial [Terriglobia bacterium]|nr:ABC transporter permease [Terriglobia bacterium]